MARKGGGRAGFVRSAMRSKAQDDAAEEVGRVEEPAGAGVASAVQEPEAVAAVSEQLSGVDLGAASPGAGAGDREVGSEDEASPALESRGKMTQRHKRELKAVKDKAKRLGKKGKEEAARLEAETLARHAAELRDLDAREGVSTGPADPSAILSAVEALAAPKEAAAPTKAAKRRAKRAAEDAERTARIERERIEEGETAGEAEAAQIETQLAALGLRRAEVQPDGHCLFRAISVARGGGKAAPEAQRQGEDEDEAEAPAKDAASASSSDASVWALRKAAAAYLRPREDELAPFVLDGSETSPSPYAAYCDKVETTAAWGGEPELVALAGALQSVIRVHEAGRDQPLTFGDKKKDDDATIDVVYLHHAFGLGEHYDAAVRI